MTSLLQKINDLDLRIDNITKQVCFIVSRGGAIVVNVDTILPYNIIFENIGDGFDSNTYTFIGFIENIGYGVQFKEGIYFWLVFIQMEITVIL